MTSPPATLNATPDFKVSVAFLPLSNGDYGLALSHTDRPGKWFLMQQIPIADLTDENVSTLIHLEPVVTEVPDDLVAQFRAQLKLGDDA